MSLCRETEVLIDKYLSKEIDKKEMESLQNHFNECSACKSQYESAIITRDFLDNDRCDTYELSQGFDQKLNNCLTTGGCFDRPRMFKFVLRKRALAFIAALIFILFAAVHFFYYVEDDEIMVSVSEVDVNQPVAIRLKYSAKTDMKRVVFFIEMDDAISFESKRLPELKTLKKHLWVDTLSKGENNIPFVVKVTALGEWKIKAGAFYDGYRYEQEIVLKVSEKAIKITHYIYKRKRVEEHI